MIRTTYDSANCILHSEFSGPITLNELMDYFYELATNSNLPDSFYYFEDHTEADFVFKAKDLKKVTRLVNTCIKRFKYIKVAIVLSKPKETAYSILALQHIKFPALNALVFSTREAATEWLMSEKVMQE